MIKRRFYRQDRGDKSDGSDSGSDSSSDSEVEDQVTDASEDSVEEVEEVQQDDEVSDRVNLQIPSSSSSSSEHESDDSSADELEVDSPSKKEKIAVLETLAKDISLPNDAGKWILKSKSVFKCRLCPKIVCLNEESLKTHLKSKRHARSEKLQKNGTLKNMLNSDGEEEEAEEDGETHAERHARILALAQEEPKKKSRGRQRQRLRMKRKKETAKEPTSQKVKKQRKNV